MTLLRGTQGGETFREGEREKKREWRAEEGGRSICYVFWGFKSHPPLKKERKKKVQLSDFPNVLITHVLEFLQRESKFFSGCDLHRPSQKVFRCCIAVILPHFLSKKSLSPFKIKKTKTKFNNTCVLLFL